MKLCCFPEILVFWIAKHRSKQIPNEDDYMQRKKNRKLCVVVSKVLKYSIFLTYLLLNCKFPSKFLGTYIYIYTVIL
jgi:hypothetical protein